jgi:FkbM family methyltransferase
VSNNDLERPWGTYALAGPWGAIARTARAMPPGRLGQRLSLWLRSPVKKKLSGPVDTTFRGLRVRLYPRGNHCESRALFMPQHYDVAELAWLRATLPADGVFIDIGANVGLYSLWAGTRPNRSSTARIIAVEPDPTIADRLAFNLALNDVPNVAIERVALSDHIGEMQLVIDSNDRGMSHLGKGVAEQDDAIAVPVRPLLVLLNAHDINRIDVAKIDVEGHEHRVLEPFFGEAEAERWPRHLIVESKRRTPQTHLIDGLRRRGYQPFLKTADNLILSLNKASQ